MASEEQVGNIVYQVQMDVANLIEAQRKVNERLEKMNGGAAKTAKSLDQLQTSISRIAGAIATSIVVEWGRAFLVAADNMNQLNARIERLTPPVWRVDGATISTFVPEKPYAGSAIDLMEKTRIHDIVDTNLYQRWAGNGRHEMSITLKGTNGVPFEVSKMYLGMNGTYDAFSRIIYPEYAEGITGASTPDFLCGMTNMVVQENPSTGQLVYTHCNIEEGFPSAKGGVFVKTTDETGASYQKVYFAWVYDSPMKINKVSAQLVKVFC